MSNSAALNKPNDATAAEQTATADKGKGKAQLVEDDSSSDEETDAIDETMDEVDEGDEDGLEEIDTSNIIQGGRRTRGAKIDLTNEMIEDDDDDDDDDFVAPREDDDDSMDTTK